MMNRKTDRQTDRQTGLRSAIAGLQCTTDIDCRASKPNETNRQSSPIYQEASNPDHVSQTQVHALTSFICILSSL
jgi:hypothetical protein